MPRMLVRIAVLAAVLMLGGVAGTASAAVPAWTTYHHDSARSGIDPDSTSPVTPTQAWQTPGLDGAIYGQPLIYGSRVYVATENDTVYALDMATGSVLWQKHLATPVGAGALNCGNIAPTVGITSTPVIDPVSGRIYVVGNTWNGSDPATIAHEMWGLSLSDGSVGVGPVAVDPPNSNPIDQLQRTSLALDAGRVIIGYGGNAGDCGSYHGWLVGVPEGGGALQSFEVDRNTNEGAIWGSGNAPPVDSAGDIWTSTGNGSGGWDYQESVVKLDSNLAVLDHWTPSNWATLDSTDTDLGSSMPLLLPGGLVFQIGKAGTGYLLNGSSLGGTGASPAFSHGVCSGSWGGGIYVNGVIYVACADGMHAETLSGNSFAALAGWTTNSGAVAAPIFAGGLVWSADSGTGTLYGLDPATGKATFSGNLNGFQHFTSPSAGGGRLFVANNDPVSGNDQVTAFRIANPPPPSATTLTLSPSANPAQPGRPIALTATVAPAPDAGTISFTDGGRPIGGCGAVPVNLGSGQASCTTTFSSIGQHSIAGAYSGDAYYTASSGSLNESVAAARGGSNGGPVLSRLRVRAVRQRLRLRLVLSEPATVSVVVSELVSGRLVHRHCRAGAKHGRRCQAAVRKVTLLVRANRGGDAFSPRMKKLAPGRYLVTVTARDGAGRRSRPVSVTVAIRRAARH